MSGIDLLPTVLSVGWMITTMVQWRRLRAARRDPLTSTWTRMPFERRARRALSRRGPDRLVVLVDIDRFKHVNDTYGHATGDRVLQMTAHQLRCWAERDPVGRLGGDEFAAVRFLTGAGDPACLVSTLHRHLQVSIRPARGLGQITVISTVGAVLVPRGTPLTAALAAAHAAMYAAKHAGPDLEGWHLDEALPKPDGPRRYKRAGLAQDIRGVAVSPRRDRHTAS